MNMSSYENGTLGRNYKIDWLRTIGTLSVILAHMNIPTIISHIRTFDVVMLVWISGFSYALSYGNKKISYGQYLLKRFKKLIIPTWILITAVFTCSFFACLCVGREQLYSVPKMLFSYLFDERGIGYIWIAKVYFLIAAVSFFLYKINEKIRDNRIFLIVVSAILAIYQSIITFTSVKNIYLFREFLNYTLAYGIISLIGIRCYTSKKFINTVLLYSLTAYACLQVAVILKYDSFSPGNFKYPPELYYLFYGLSVGILLYIIIPNNANRIVLWFSKNSFTVYLLHILAMLAYSMCLEMIDIQLLKMWYIEYPIIVFASVFATVIINRLKQWRCKYVFKAENEK